MCKLGDQHPYDTLEKYSYPLVTIGVNPRGRTSPLQVGTAFFYRLQNKLFLITAYHVVTQCEIYDADDRRREEPDSLDVWFRDTAEKYRTYRMPLDRYKVKKCQKATEIPDLDILDVSEHFRDIPVYSVEKFLCHPCGDIDNMADHDTMVCYGFSNIGPNMPVYRDNEITCRPVGFFVCGNTSDLDVTDEQYSARYYFTVRTMPQGASGAPVFRVRQKAEGWNQVELVGIQSGTRHDTERSTIVKQKELVKMLAQLK
ncbi:MAG TPA: hypothetical protein VGM31_19025 [Puia sp.]